MKINKILTFLNKKSEEIKEKKNEMKFLFKKLHGFFFNEKK